jgi:glutaredoxin
MSRYNEEICPYCEMRKATDADEREYQRRLVLANDDEKDPQLVAWENTLCWSKLFGICEAANDPHKRLIAVLEERDALREEITRLRADDVIAMSVIMSAGRIIGEMRAALEAVEWDGGMYRSRQCPWCRAFDGDGHRADCGRQAALGIATA